MVKTSDYKLSATDTDKSRRNFPGYREDKPFSLSDIIKGQDSEGTTDTDSKTDKNGNRRSGYTRIYSKSGKAYG